MDSLVVRTTEFLEQQYKKPLHTVAAGLETSSGHVYFGTNIDHFSGYVCAETSVLAMAMNADETQFSRIVAVHKELEEVAVVNPCGKCRQIFYDYTPGITALLNTGSDPIEQTIEELLPYGFTRQREKNQAAVSNKNTGEVVG